MTVDLICTKCNKKKNILVDNIYQVNIWIEKNLCSCGEQYKMDNLDWLTQPITFRGGGVGWCGKGASAPIGSQERLDHELRENDWLSENIEKTPQGQKVKYDMEKNQEKNI
jgi:hypothetical protein